MGSTTTAARKVVEKGIQQKPYRGLPQASHVITFSWYIQIDVSYTTTDMFRSDGYKLCQDLCQETKTKARYWSS